MINKTLSFFLLLLLLSACTRSLYVEKTDHHRYPISDTLEADSSIIALIRPYKDSLTEEMNEIIAYTTGELIKAQPESSLGNFMADVIYHKAAEYADEPVDFGITNYGGIRVPSLPEGAITKGDIFKLMPFENFIVVITVSGQTVKEMIEQMAAAGGWPVSGISYQIKNGKPQNILINNEPLSLMRSYRIAITDYIANGGDNMAMLVDKPQEQLGVLYRDAIIEYLKDRHQSGEKIVPITEGRVINAR